jgi:hypothetical protein
MISGLVAAPLLAQTTRRTAIVPAFTPRESGPAFVVECYNNSAAAVPWPMIRTIRLDGNDQELAGGIVGSLIGSPDERFEVAPGASHRMLLVLSQGTGTSSSPGQGFGARVRQGWTLPVTPGTHRSASGPTRLPSLGVPTLHRDVDPCGRRAIPTTPEQSRCVELSVPTTEVGRRGPG